MCIFTLDERKDMIEESLRHLDKCQSRLLFRTSGRTTSTPMASTSSLEGLRATMDFEYEIQMAQMNARLFDETVETVFLMTDPKYSFISSSMMKGGTFIGRYL